MTKPKKRLPRSSSLSLGVEDQVKAGKIIRNLLIRFFLLIALIAITIGAYFYFKPKLEPAGPPKEVEANENESEIYVSFLLEVQNKIKENYWKKISDEELSELFKLAIEKVAEEQQEPATTTKESSVTILDNDNSLETLFTEKFKNLNNEDKKEFTVNIASLVLANLAPFNRSGLYTTKKVQQLSDEVKNIDPAIDLYADLGVEKNAPQDQVELAYEKKLEELEQVIQDETKSAAEKTQANDKLTQIKRANETLSIPGKRETYDEEGIEATTKSNILTDNIAYLQIKKFSPTTYEEFVNDLDRLEDQPSLKYLVLDLRSNIGGSIDYLPYFLGVFLGNNQYAYDWLHQDEYTPFRTKTDKMAIISKLKNMIILTDKQTQSSSEVMAATLKKYNLAIVVGAGTKGWGTIEKVFPIDNQIDPENETYSMFMVHSITIRDNDGQPIEGRGIDPNINTDDEGWEKQFLEYCENQELVDAVKKLLEE